MRAVRLYKGRTEHWAVCEASYEPGVWLARERSEGVKMSDIRRRRHRHRLRTSHRPGEGSCWVRWWVAARMIPKACRAGPRV